MKQRVDKLPQDPGCYLFKDAAGNVLYIGKAKDLRARVRSYFSSDVSGKTAVMISKARDVQTIACRNEAEALLLENQLIRQHKPPYNIMLRENRRYAWILVTNEEYPRIITARNKRRSGTYYGPYTDGYARRQLVISLNKLFQLRTCRVLPKKVCLQYHIGNCTGPCQGHDSRQEYAARAEQAERVLKGDVAGLRAELLERMGAASRGQRYEQAKRYRDMLRGLEHVEAKQIVEREESRDQDVIGVAMGEDVVFAVLQVRRGVIHNKREYTVPAREGVLEEFLTALYRERVPPGEVIVDGIQEDRRVLLEEYLTAVAEDRVSLITPQRGDRKKLLELARRNAEIAASGEDNALQHLEEKLRLSAPPETIDCFDVSTHQGAETVAASVRYRNGRPDPSGYRRFRIRTAVHDDYAAMAEAVSRRYREDPPPDLVVIDGGKGQLAAAREALHAEHPGTPIIALAKRQEEVYVPGLSVPLQMDDRDPGLLLLRRIRDAAHRFVIRHHRGRRRKAVTASLLDHMPGIGPKRKELLYDRFKMFSNIKRASKKQLQDVLGEKTGATVHRALQEEKNDE